MRFLDLVMWGGTVVPCPAETAIVLVPRDERPLRGDAGRLDWRLCGEISRLLQSGFASGATGESLLIPARAPVAAERLLLFGLGLSKHLGARRIEQALERSVGKAIQLGAERVSLALPESIDLEIDAASIVSGLVQALEQRPAEARLCLLLPVLDAPPEAVPEAARQQREEARARGVRIEVRHFDRAPGREVPRASPPASAPLPPAPGA